MQAAGANPISGLDLRPAARPQGLAARQASFADVLGQASRVSGRQTPAQEARKAAEQLVSAALIQPMLAQLRESTQAAPPFAPTQAEKQFRALADVRLADDIVRSASLPIVDRIASDLLQRSASLGQAQGSGEVSGGRGVR